jgi:hypothetical protein
MWINRVNCCNVFQFTLIWDPKVETIWDTLIDWCKKFIVNCQIMLKLYLTHTKNALTTRFNTLELIYRRVFVFDYLRMVHQTYPIIGFCVLTVLLPYRYIYFTESHYANCVEVDFVGSCFPQLFELAFFVDGLVNKMRKVFIIGGVDCVFCTIIW